MGMFDYIRCKMPLPDEGPADTDQPFQTKDTPDQYMTVYTIEEDGRLTWRPYEMVEVPPQERRYPDPDHPLHIIGMIKRVEQETPAVVDDFHGDIFFYTNGEAGEWFEYRARFTEGRCTGIRRVEGSRYG